MLKTLMAKLKTDKSQGKVVEKTGGAKVGVKKPK